MTATKVGYISRRVNESGKETFKYIESDFVRRISKRSDSVKAKIFLKSVPYEEIKDNTDLLKQHKDIMLVTEPFFTDEELKARCEKWCEWANNCKHREYSFLGEFV